MLTKHKTVAGKQTCDRCKERRPPIEECSWPWSPGESRAYWLDLCSPCIEAIQAHCERGGSIGPFGELNPPRMNSTRGRKRIGEEVLTDG